MPNEPHLNNISQLTSLRGELREFIKPEGDEVFDVPSVFNAVRSSFAFAFAFACCIFVALNVIHVVCVC